MLFAIGSSHSAGPAQSLDRHARALARLGLFRQVRTAVMIGGPSPREALQDLDGDVYIVPMMMCTGWIRSTQIPTSRSVRSILQRRLTHCAPVRPTRSSSGAGPPYRLPSAGCGAAARGGAEACDPAFCCSRDGSRPEDSQHITDRHAAWLRETGTFAEVLTAYLDRPRQFRRPSRRSSGRRWSRACSPPPGPHAEEDVPRLISEGKSPMWSPTWGRWRRRRYPDIVLSIVRRRGRSRPTTATHGRLARGMGSSREVGDDRAPFARTCLAPARSRRSCRRHGRWR